MSSILVLLAAQNKTASVGQTIFVWAMIFLFFVYCYKKEEPEKERRRKQPKKKNPIVKSWIFTIFFSLIMLAAVNAILTSYENEQLSFFSFIILFSIFYRAAVSVKKNTNFRLLFRKKSIEQKNRVAKSP